MTERASVRPARRAGRRSRFTVEQRREAVRRVAEDPDELSEVAGELGVDPSTVRRWARREDAPGPQPARSELLSACQRLVETHCYAELSVERVAEEAGVSECSAYQHFGSKEALFAAAAEDAGRRVSAALVPAVAGVLGDEQAPAEQLAGVLVAGMQASMCTPGVMVLFADVGIPRSTDPGQVWHEAFAGACSVPMARAAQEGSLVAGLTPLAATRIVSESARVVVAGALSGDVPPEGARAVLERLPATVMT